MYVTAFWTVKLWLEFGLTMCRHDRLNGILSEFRLRNRQLLLRQLNQSCVRGIRVSSWKWHKFTFFRFCWFILFFLWDLWNYINLATIRCDNCFSGNTAWTEIIRTKVIISTLLNKIYDICGKVIICPCLAVNSISLLVLKYF